MLYGKLQVVPLLIHHSAGRRGYQACLGRYAVRWNRGMGMFDMNLVKRFPLTSVIANSRKEMYALKRECYSGASDHIFCPTSGG